MALLLPAELSKSRHENDTSDIRRNLRLRYRDAFKHNREHEWVYHHHISSMISFHFFSMYIICRLCYCRICDVELNVNSVLVGCGILGSICTTRCVFVAIDEEKQAGITAAASKDISIYMILQCYTLPRDSRV